MAIEQTLAPPVPDLEYRLSSHDNRPFSSTSERSLREKLGLGDLGLALFVPIDEEMFPIKNLEQREHSVDEKEDCYSDCESVPRDVFLEDFQVEDVLPHEEQKCESTSPETYEFDTLPTVIIEPPDDPSELVFAPRIISEKELQQIMTEALPTNLQMFTTWKRLFSINLHGDSIATLLDRCKSFRYTLLVVKTADGYILGGFASEPWGARANITNCTYYGTGASFLFSNYPDQPDGRLSFYKWVGANDYCQLCDVSTGRLALGGGGNFGLIIDNNFLQGSTGPCATFENPSLVPAFGGSFDIVEFEVYGIVPLMETIHFRDQ